MNQAKWLVGLGWVGILSQVTAAAADPVPASVSSSRALPAAVSQALPAAIATPRPAAIAGPERIGADPLIVNAGEDPMAQVQSVEQLSDVQPTDWAYQAVKALVEKYGALSGYVDGTFQGDRPLSRYEFAAAVRRVIAQVEQQLNRGDIVQAREDFAALRRAVENDNEIAADLQRRLGKLDAQVDKLTQQQFSTTTKLTGQTVGVITDGSRARMTIVSRTRLTLQTSFGPNNLLVTQLESGNEGNDAIGQAHDRRRNLLGTEGLLAGGGGLDYVGVGSPLRLSKLYYSFQPAKDLSLTIGSKLAPRDFIDYNRYANDSATNAATNFSSSFFANNPLIVQNQIDRPGGAGAVLVWQPSRLPFTLRALYVAADADRPNSGVTEGGLFGDRNQGSLELEYPIRKNFTVRLQYTQATVNNTDISAGGINAEVLVNRQFGIFGRFGFAHYSGFNSVLNQDLDLHPKTWAIGATLRQVFIPGSTAGIAIGQPFVERSLGKATQTNFEIYYSLLLNDNISFTPMLMLVTNPNNQARPAVFQGAVRLVYSF